MEALWSLAMEEVEAVKVAEVEAAATETEAGTESAALLSERVTEAPPAGAALVRETVQVVEALEPMLVGLQVREETRTDATRLTVALAEEEL